MMPEERAEIEARRSIVRDAAGRIIRSEEWKQARIAFMLAKRAECETRIGLIDRAVEQLRGEAPEQQKPQTSPLPSAPGWWQRFKETAWPW